MALIVAPDEGFDSLVSLEDAAAYMGKYGHAWPAEEAKQEIALRQATQYLLTAYSIAPDHLAPVHDRVKAACCEAAVRASKGQLLKDSDGRVKTEQTVGPITTKWAEGVQGGKTSYPVIDALLKGLTDGGSLNLKLVRG
nr:MAG TPA: Putative Head Tail Connector Protein [Caudoviricetes sp.]